MTDRELLELAAKAAGIAIEWHCWPSTSKPRAFVKNGLVAEIEGDGYDEWNPLTDDRDALRLALALGLSFEPYPLYSTEKHSVIVKQRRRSDQLRESNPTECIERYQGDPMGATRRAIVRAAAAIGEAMKP